MKAYLGLLTFVWLIIALVARAQMPMEPTPLGNRVSAAVYTGPVDVVSGPIECWSMRACSAAARGTKAVNVCNVSDVACADLSTDATTGNLTVTTIGGSDCSSVTCTVKTWYGQVNSVNITNATIAARPIFVTSCPTTSKPCARETQAAGQRLLVTLTPGGGNISTSVSSVIQRSGNFTSAGVVWAAVNVTSGTTYGIYFNNSTNTCAIFITSNQTATCSDSTWHRVQTVLNGASSHIYVDGSDNAVGSPGTAASYGSGNNIAVGCEPGTCSNVLTGYVEEVIPYSNVAFTGTQMSNLDSNQHTYWGI